MRDRRGPGVLAAYLVQSNGIQETEKEKPVNFYPGFYFTCGSDFRGNVFPVLPSVAFERT